MSYEVTIGIPVYESVDYIRRTMESALAQTFQSIEFLILDDCGNDGSISVIEDYQKSHIRGSNIRILHNEKNCGVGCARNRIIDEAKGKYLFFLDSDDYIESNTIQLLFDTLTENQSQIVYGSYDIIDFVHSSSTIQYKKPFLELEGEGELAVFAFKYGHVFQVSVCNFLINVQFLRSTGLRFLSVSFWEDMAFTFELVTKVRKAVLLPNLTYHYVRRPNSLSHYQDRLQFRKSEILKNVSTIDYLKDKCREFENRSFISYLCYRLEMNSFYVVCYVLKYTARINPRISMGELRDFMWYPIPFSWILKFRHKMPHNLSLWMISHMPLWLFEITVRVLGKLKNVI